jgi:hypothetical protein
MSRIARALAASLAMVESGDVAKMKRIAKRTGRRRTSTKQDLKSCSRLRAAQSEGGT